MRSFYITPVLALALGLAAAAYGQDNDKARDFLKKAMEGDNSEVMLGKLAVQQGDSAAVKRFGQMLVDDHSKHLPKVEKVASGLNVPADDQPMPEAQKERDKLMGMHGADFDKEFAKYMVTDHRKDLADYRKAAKMPGPVGKLARQTLPTLQKHLSTAEHIKS